MQECAQVEVRSTSSAILRDKDTYSSRFISDLNFDQSRVAKATPNGVFLPLCNIISPSRSPLESLPRIL